MSTADEWRIRYLKRKQKRDKQIRNFYIFITVIFVISILVLTYFISQPELLGEYLGKFLNGIERGAR